MTLEISRVGMTSVEHDIYWLLVSKTVTAQSVDEVVVKYASSEGVIHQDKALFYVSVLELFE